MFVVQYGGDEHPEKYSSCVVWDSWRLVGENELYDLAVDPGQVNNIAKSNPEITSKMKSFYESWWAKTEPEINQFVPVIIGSEKENPVIINSNNWEEGAVNSQWKIALGEGSVKGGICHIYSEKEGRYRMELSRWPFHLKRDLTIKGPASSYASTKIRTGRAIPVKYGCISLNNDAPVVESVKPEDKTKVIIEVAIPSGESRIQVWFKDEYKNDLCGAYYVRIERIPN